MKVLLCVLFLASYCGKTAKAQEGNNPEVKPESDISATTKKALRKIGRKSMDTTCELTKSKAECEKERLEHKEGAMKDEADTEKREAAKAEKKKMKDEKHAQMKMEDKKAEQECHDENGKIVCAGQKIKHKVKEMVK